MQAIVANPELELVGCYAWSADKVGRRRRRAGRHRPGRRRRHQRRRRPARPAARLRRLQPDVARRRRAGAHPRGGRQRGGHRGVHHRPQPRRRTATGSSTPASRAASSMFGTGISPGFAELLAIVAAGICDRIDKVTVTEAADTTFYDSPDTERPAGFGQPIDDPELPGMAAAGHRGVRRGRGHGRRRPRRRARRGRAARRSTPRPPRTSTWRRGPSRPGCVAGVAASWQGLVGDRVDRRAQRALEEGADARAGLDDRAGRLGHPDRRPAHRDAPPSTSCRRRTSRPRPSTTSW